MRAQAAQRKTVRPQLLEMLNGVDEALRKPLVGVLTRLSHAEKAALEPGPILAIVPDASRHLRAACAMPLGRCFHIGRVERRDRRTAEQPERANATR